jgi:hypothetical protein
MTQYKEELLKFLTSSALLSAHLPNASKSDLDTLAKFQTALQVDGGSERQPGPKGRGPLMGPKLRSSITLWH